MAMAGLTPSDIGRGSGWVMVYPTYLDVRCSIPEGRKIPKEDACEKVHLIDLVEACRFLRLPCIVETRKRYPRDWLRVGRIRILLRQPDGTPTVEGVKTRRDMYKLLARTIPTLENRAQRVAEIDMHMASMSVAAGVSNMAALSKAKADVEETVAAASGAPPPGAAVASPTGKKKSSKKKGRK